MNTDKDKGMYDNIDKKSISKIPAIAKTMTREELERRKYENEIFDKVLNVLKEMEDEKTFFEKLYAKLDELSVNDEDIAPVLMPIEEENKWYQEMLIENAKEEGYMLGTQNGINQGILQGISQGISQKARDVVHNMLNKNFNLKTISEITGLSEKEIEKISKDMNLN